MKEKKFLIFDLDDTIFDFKKGEQEGLSNIFAEHPVSEVTFDQWLPVFKKVNSNTWKQIEEGGSAKDLLNTRFSKTYQAFGIEADGTLLERTYRSYLDQSYFVLEGAKALLDRLQQQGFVLIAGTNGKSSTQRNRLKGTGLAEMFEDIVISDEIGIAKPNRLFFEQILKRNSGMTKSNTLMIGDSLRSDIQGAIHAELKNIWFNLYALKNHTNIQPDAECRTFQEVEQQIKQLFTL